VKYDSIHVGKTVLYSRHRTFSSSFSLAGCVTAEVLAKDLTHSYRTVGNFSEAGKSKVTQMGVRVRLTSGPDEGSELVTQSSYLVEADEETLVSWRSARIAVEVREQERIKAREGRDAMRARFAARGFEVSITAGGSLTVASADVERLIAWLERSPGPLA
jgi:hypothetical protein